MKKILAMLLAFTMMITMAMPTFAAEAGGGNNQPSTETGSITINGVGAETIYDIYQIFTLGEYDTTNNKYPYEIVNVWKEFFETGKGKDYIIKDKGTLVWNVSTDDSVVSKFAKEALEYAEEKGISPTKSSENDGEFTITENSETKIKTGVFSNLPLGYYLVDSTMGALCALTTTNPAASVNAKNGIPTVEKQVKEDSTEQWGTSNTADIGQIIEYRVTINVHAGAQNYVLYDEMDPGIEYQELVKIEHVIPGKETHTMTMQDNYEVSVAADKGSFNIEFTKELCDKLSSNDKIIVYYKAMLMRDAVIAGNGNKNKAWLTFGENNNISNESETITKTYAIDIIKTDNQNILIDGAEFKVYDASTDGNEIKIVLMDDRVTYRRAREDEQGVNIVARGGKVRVVGFDNGTYYLEEVVVPEHYNKLEGRQKFIISDANLDAVFNNGIFSTGSGVHVVNYTGQMLPETGGAGTVMFIVGGMIVVLGAGVLLVTKKRMNMIK